MILLLFFVFQLDDNDNDDNIDNKDVLIEINIYLEKKMVSKPFFFNILTNDHTMQTSEIVCKRYSIHRYQHNIPYVNKKLKNTK